MLTLVLLLMCIHAKKKFFFNIFDENDVEMFGIINYWLNNTILKKCSLKTFPDIQQDKG